MTSFLVGLASGGIMLWLFKCAPTESVRNVRLDHVCDVNPEGTTERIISLYQADRELRSAAERVGATWLERKEAA